MTQAGGMKGTVYLAFSECCSDLIPSSHLTGTSPAHGPAENLSSPSSLHMTGPAFSDFCTLSLPYSVFMHLEIPPVVG